MFELINALNYENNDVNEVIKALGELEQSVTILEIRNLGAYREHSIEDLIRIVESIKQPIRALILENDCLGLYDNASLSRLMQALPTSINSLSLVNNNLGVVVNTLGEEEAFLAFIPSSVISLNLGYNDLGDEEHGCPAEVLKFQRLLASIPEHVVRLSLSHNALDSYSGLDLQQLFSAIPSQVLSLDLSSNDLCCEDLALSLSVLQSVKSLNLRSSALYIKSDNLKKMFESLPPVIRHLNLKDCALDTIPDENLLAGFSSLPRSLKSLDIGLNHLYKLRIASMLNLLKALKNANISELDLSSNELANYYTYAMLHHLQTHDYPMDAELPPLDVSGVDQKLRDLMTNIPSTVISLNLTDNDLERIEEPYRSNIWQNLPLTITNSWKQRGRVLGNRVNCFEVTLTNINKTDADGLILKLQKLDQSITEVSIDFMPVTSYTLQEMPITLDLDAMLGALPTQVNSLGLILGLDAKNWLPAMLSSMQKAPGVHKLVCILDAEILADLEYVFTNLPPQITEIELGFNDPELINMTQLIRALGRLPRHVRHLQLPIDNFTAKDNMSLAAYIASANSQVAMIDKGKTVENLSDFALERFESSLGRYFKKDSHIDLYSAVSLLNEEQTLSLIALMQKHSNPFAQLFCAFLLEGRIENSLGGYLDKRLQDAIGFYCKAANHESLTPVISMILWQYRCCSTISSITERLAAFDVNPSHYATNFSLFSSKQSRVLLPWFKPLSIRPATDEVADENLSDQDQKQLKKS